MAGAKPLARADLDIVEMEGEAVVLDGLDGSVEYLNPSAALVFGLCDGRTTIKEMVEAIADVFEVAEDKVEREVRELVRSLRKLGMLEPTSSSKRKELERLRAERREPMDERKRTRIDVAGST